MKIKELLEGRHGYDDSGMSLSPGNDEGEDSWDYSAAHDRIGAGDPRRHRQHYQHQVDVPHDVHINGRKWKTFGSKSHAEAVARKLAANGKKVHVQQALEDASAGATSAGSIATAPRPVGESATVGATSAANIGTVVSPQLSPGKARGKKSYTGSMATGSGTKAPPQPKVTQPKNKDGTAKNGLDIKGTSLFGGPANEAVVVKRR
jgi:hypothetical protein